MLKFTQEGFHWDKLTVDNKTINNQLHSQSADIGLGTDDFGAADQEPKGPAPGRGRREYGRARGPIEAFVHSL